MKIRQQLPVTAKSPLSIYAVLTLMLCSGCAVGPDTALLNSRYPATGVSLWPVAPHTVANRSQSGGRPFVISSSMR